MHQDNRCSRVILSLIKNILLSFFFSGLCLSEVCHSWIVIQGFVFFGLLFRGLSFLGCYLVGCPSRVCSYFELQWLFFNNYIPLNEEKQNWVTIYFTQTSNQVDKFKKLLGCTPPWMSNTNKCTENVNLEKTAYKTYYNKIFQDSKNIFVTKQSVN